MQNVSIEITNIFVSNHKYNYMKYLFPPTDMHYHNIMLF